MKSTQPRAPGKRDAHAPSCSPGAGDVLPQSREAEAAVIGALLRDDKHFPLVAASLTSADFYSANLRTIFRAIAAEYTDNGRFDAVTVCDRLGDHLEKVGGHSFVMSLDAGVSAAHLEGHCRVVREKARMRTLIASMTECAELLRSNRGGDRSAIDQVVAKATRACMDVQADKAGPVPVADVVPGVMARYGEGEEPHPGLPSGFPDLDRISGGFRSHMLTILAGRPSMGKTTFALNVFSNTCISANKRGMLFSLESAKDEIVNAWLSAHANVSNTQMRDRILSVAEVERIEAAAKKLEGADIVIDDSPGLNIYEVRARALAQHARKPLDLVALDYLQLVKGAPGRRYERRDLEVAEVSTGLKNLAKEIGVPVIALAQLNRGLEKREDKRPTMADLRESGSIEQDADLIVLLHRPGYWGKTTKARLTHDALAIVGKNRHGAVGAARLYFDYEHYRFASAAAGGDDDGE